MSESKIDWKPVTTKRKVLDGEWKCKQDYFYPQDPSQRTNLIVNYIPEGMCEVELEEMFAICGPIDSVRLEKKMYGFIKFRHHEDARTAIEIFHERIERGKKLCVKWACPGGNRDKSNLFISGLPSNWDTEELKTAFEQFGKIMEVRVLKGDDRQSLQKGFVRFNTVEESNEAIKQRDHWVVPGTRNILQVQVARQMRSNKKKYTRKYGADGVCRTSYDVQYDGHPLPEMEGTGTDANVPRSAANEFKILQRKASIPTQHVFAKEQDGSRSVAYDRDHPQQNPQASFNIMSRQFENFSQNPPDAFQLMPYRPNAVRLDPNGHITSDIAAFDTTTEQAMDYTWRTYYPPKRVGSKACLFVCNVPTTATEVFITNIASRYGVVEDINIQLDNGGRNIGCVIITFESQAEALHAWRHMDRATMLGQQIEVHYGY